MDSPAEEVLELNDDFVTVTASVWELLLQAAADHGGDDFVDGDVFDLRGGYHLSVAHDRGAIAQGEDLFQAMGDVNDRNPFIPQLAQDVEETLDLQIRQSSGGLVHDQHSRLDCDCPCDRDHRLLNGSEPAGHLVDRDVLLIQPLELLACNATKSNPIDDAAPGRRLVAEKGCFPQP